MPQVDTRTRWLRLDDQHADYAAIIADLAALAAGHAETYSNVAGSVANTRVVRSYMTDAELIASSPSLAIGGCVLDQVDYWSCHNMNAGPLAIDADNEWDEPVPCWGKFLRDPDALPTAGIDAVVQQWTDGVKAIMYIGVADVGSGNGSSYLNRSPITDFLHITPGSAAVDLRNSDIVVLCGDISRVYDGLTAGSGFYGKTGTAIARTQVVSHPVDTAALYGANTFTGFSDEGGGVWSKVTGATITDHIIVTSKGGTRRGLTKVASEAACAATVETTYVSGGTVYVHLTDGSDPSGAVYVPTTIGGVNFFTRNLQYCDFTGIEFWQASFLGTFHYYRSDTAFYACKFKCARDIFASNLNGMNRRTGRFVSAGGETDFVAVKPWLQANLIIKGCEFQNTSAPVYDNTDTTDACSTGLVFSDNYVHQVNAPAVDNFGYIDTKISDSHTVAVYGSSDGWTVENNRMEKSGNQNIVFYNNPYAWYPADTVLSDGTFTNGTFNTDLTGWTDNDTGTGASTQTGGKLRLNGGASGVAKRTQAVTIGAAFIDTNANGDDLWQVIRIETGTALDLWNYNGPRIYIDVGTSDGGNQLFNGTTTEVYADQDGIAAIWFVPTGTTFYVSLYNAANSNLDINTVTLLTDMTLETAYTEVGKGNPPSAFWKPDDPANTFDNSPYVGKEQGWTICRNHSVQYNWISDPYVGTVPTIAGNGVGIDIGGNSGLAGYKGRIANIEIAHNRIIGAGASDQGTGTGNFDYAMIRTKAVLFIDAASHPSPVAYDTLHIHHNTLIGGVNAFNANNTGTYDEAGIQIRESFKFNDNVVHAYECFVAVNEVGANPGTCIHKIVLEDNTYIAESGTIWANYLGSTTSFATWQSRELSGDTLDTVGSTAGNTVPTSTGDGTITIDDTTPIVGQTLTATMNADDPDGAASNHSYQWFEDDELIAGATSATFSVQSAQLGKPLKVQDLYQAAGAFKLIVSAATSNVGAAEGGGGGTFRASVFAAGVVA